MILADRKEGMIKAQRGKGEEGRNSEAQVRECRREGQRETLDGGQN